MVIPIGEALSFTLDKVPDWPLARQALHTLESYECWEPFFALIHHALSLYPEREETYTQLARVHGVKLGNYQKAADILKDMVNKCRPSLRDFRQRVLPYVLNDNDYAREALILSGIYEFFTEGRDKVLALERLCHLYEKKAPNQDQLSVCFSRLLDLDPENLKALRYFKMLYMQENDWPEVVSILERIVKVVLNHESYRAAQELAAVYLYQLDNPKEALQVITTHCSGSPLDTSTISYDAYYRLSDWHGCIGVLRSHLPKSEDRQAKAVLHYKIGSIFELIGDMDSAEDNYKIATELQQNFLEPMESLICIYTDRKEWRNLALWLRKLQGEIHSQEQKNKIQDALSRLQKIAVDATL
jgi:tetratricopeptide (TPR) repeat protein